MRDELLSYYERELTFLRQTGAEFAGQYPKVASRLMLEPNRCEDPHVERLIESTAFLAARIHLRLDDDFPELTQALLNTVYPHYIRPIPSFSIAEFHMRKGGVVAGQRIPRGTMLYSKPVEGMPVRFQTAYDTELWPLTIPEAGWCSIDRLDPPLRASNAAAVLRVRLDCWPGASFSQLPISSFRFYLDGETLVTHSLYELLSNNCTGIVLRNPRPKLRQRPIELLPEALTPVGFDEKESLLPYTHRSFGGYRLLQEYFAFPEKFFFFDLRGMEALRAGGFQESVEILFLISPFERFDRQDLLSSGVGQNTLRLGCSPITNLFPHTAEPIQWDQTQYEYPIVPDFRQTRVMDIFSVDQVSCTYEKTGETAPFEPFFSFRHSTSKKTPAFWNATRRESRTKPGGQMWLTLVDLGGNPVSLDLDTLTVRCTCTNGDLPSRLPIGDENGDFVLEEGGAIRRIAALRKPTRTLRPLAGRHALWRLISHLSLNYLSLVEDGREAFQEMLRLYQTTSPELDHQVDGITSVSSSRRFARVAGDHGISYVRGVRVQLELDESKFVGAGVYLFASVLEHFLAQYGSLNSFSQLVVKTPQRKEVLREWPPRAGKRILM